MLERHPQIDLLVNNAGIAARSSFVGGDPDRIAAVVETNYLGSVWVTLAFLPGLGRGSHLVNIVSVAGEVADGPYSASKHAQLAFSRSIALELAPRGIAVHTVKPGFVETPGFPQKGESFVRGLVTAQPSLVVSRILGAIEHDRRELTVPRWYRLFALLQAFAPATLARLRAAAGR